VKLWRADRLFFMAELNGFAPRGELSRIEKDEVVGEFEGVDMMLVKTQQVARGMPDSVKVQMTMTGTIPDPPIIGGISS